MAIEYKWSFGNPDCKVSENGLENVIDVIHWRLTGSEDGLTAEEYGTAKMQSPNESDFTPYEQVTEPQMIEWTSEVLNASEGFKIDRTVEGIKARIAKSIEAQKNPEVVSMPLPFAN